MVVQMQKVTPNALPLRIHNQQVHQSKNTNINFADTLKSAINQVNKTQVKSNQMTVDLANGKATNLHDVMIAGQKASITLETTVQIQSKVLDAYNKIMRMQV